LLFPPAPDVLQLGVAGGGRDLPPRRPCACAPCGGFSILAHTPAACANNGNSESPAVSGRFSQASRRPRVGCTLRSAAVAPLGLPMTRCLRGPEVAGRLPCASSLPGRSG
jgi:hypothetical protein